MEVEATQFVVGAIRDEKIVLIWLCNEESLPAPPDTLYKDFATVLTTSEMN